MHSIHPHPDAFLQALTIFPKNKPVTMLNLLKFRRKALYFGDAVQCSGREAYARYIEQALTYFEAVGGEVVWEGQVMAAMIAPDGESWDELEMIRFPSIENFLDMIENPGYQAITEHRSAALKDSRLIAMVEKKSTAESA